METNRFASAWDVWTQGACGKPERNLVKGDTRVRRFPLFWSIHSLEAVCPLPFFVLNNLLASLEEEIYVYLRMQEYPPRQELH